MKHLFLIILLFISLCLWAQNVPQTIDYQGRLADSDGNYLNSVVTLDFLIYDMETAGTALWTETQDVSCINGVFHVQLGAFSPLPSTLFDISDPWLELVVGGETLAPRTAITSVPYAIKAETAYSLYTMGAGSGLDADLLDGQDSSEFMPATTDNWVNTTGDTMTGQLIVQNNVGIGTDSPTAELDVNGDVNISGVIDAVGSRENGTFSFVESTLPHTSAHNSILHIQNASDDPSSEANIQFASGSPAHGRATISATHDVSAGLYNGNLNLEVRYGTTNYRKAITMRSSGNVGIGNEDPSEKLSVSGMVESTIEGFKFPNGTVQTTAASVNSVLPPGMIVPFAGDATSIPEGWLLCDGNEINRASFANLFNIIGTNYGSGDNSSTFNLPDLRGLFLRGVDGGSGNDPNATSRTAANPGGNTGDNVGSQQETATGQPSTPFSTNTTGNHNHSGNSDTVGNHSHSGSTSSNGNHSHNLLRPQGGSGAIWGISTNYINEGIGSDGGYPLSVTGTALNTNSTGDHSHTLTTNTTGNHSHNLLINNNGNHAHSIIGGDTETRPVNVYVNYIIKF